jgi:Response regulators consisting of a CheY-like receiver domain and a winged-helix DNA-binding domain
MALETEAQLRDRIEYLEAEIANLRDELGFARSAEQVTAVRRCFRISPMQAKLLVALMDGRQRSYDALRQALWDSVDDCPETNSLQVQIAHLRKALAHFDIGFSTIWGYGLQMNAEDCAKASAILEKHGGP